MWIYDTAATEVDRVWVVFLISKGVAISVTQSGCYLLVRETIEQETKGWDNMMEVNISKLQKLLKIFNLYRTKSRHTEE